MKLIVYRNFVLPVDLNRIACNTGFHAACLINILADVVFVNDDTGCCDKWLQNKVLGKLGEGDAGAGR